MWYLKEPQSVYKNWFIKLPPNWILTGLFFIFPHPFIFFFGMFKYFPNREDCVIKEFLNIRNIILLLHRSARALWYSNFPSWQVQLHSFAEWKSDVKGSWNDFSEGNWQAQGSLGLLSWDSFQSEPLITLPFVFLQWFLKANCSHLFQGCVTACHRLRANIPHFWNFSLELVSGISCSPVWTVRRAWMHLQGGWTCLNCPSWVPACLWQSGSGLWAFPGTAGKDWEKPGYKFARELWNCKFLSFSWTSSERACNEMNGNKECSH